MTKDDFEIEIDSLKYLRVTNGVGFLCSSTSCDVIRELDVFENNFIAVAYQAGYNQRAIEDEQG